MVVNAEDVVNIMGGMEQSGGIKLNDHKRKLKNRFEICKKLGQGTYGKVQLGINKETGQEVAIKTIKKSKIETEADLIRIRREIQIMSSVQHPNIIHIYEVFENKEKMVLVMEVAAGGELYDYLSDRKSLDELEARRVFRQIATAVYYCHKHNICHRDLKLENILLDESGGAKIADFGLSNVFDRKNLLSTFCGSPLYASPEIVKGCPYEGPEVDCWSLGVLLYTLVYGAMPFDGSNFKRLVKQITTGDYYEPKQPASASSLIRGMLTVNAEARASILDICAHWWINEGYPTSCLEEAEYLSTLTPVRLDLLLSLAPQSKAKEIKDDPEKEEVSIANDDATTMSIEEMPEDAQIPSGVEECDVSLSEEPPEEKLPANKRKDRESKSKRKLEQTASMVEKELVHKKHESEAVIKQQNIPQPPKISVPEPMEVSDAPQVYERPRSRRTREEKETKDNLRTPRVRRKHHKSSDELSDKVGKSMESKSQELNSNDGKMNQRALDKNSNSDHQDKHHKTVRKEKKKYADQSAPSTVPYEQTESYTSTKTPQPIHQPEPPRTPPPISQEPQENHASLGPSPSVSPKQPKQLKQPKPPTSARPPRTVSFERLEPHESPKQPPVPSERSESTSCSRPPSSIPVEQPEPNASPKYPPIPQERSEPPTSEKPPPSIPVEQPESQTSPKPPSIPEEQPKGITPSVPLPPIPFDQSEPPRTSPSIPFERPEPHASQRPPRLPSPDFSLEPMSNHDTETLDKDPSFDSDNSIPPPLPEKRKKAVSANEEKYHSKEVNLPKRNMEEIVKKPDKKIQFDAIRTVGEEGNRNKSNAINHSDDLQMTGEAQISKSQKALSPVTEVLLVDSQSPVTHSTVDDTSKIEQTTGLESTHELAINKAYDTNQKSGDKIAKETGNSRQLNSNSSVIIPLDESNVEESAKCDLIADKTKREKQTSHVENGPNIDLEKRTEIIGKPCAIVNISAESPKDPDGKCPSGPSPAIQHQNERKLPSDVKQSNNRVPLKIVRKNSKRFGSPPLVKPFPTQSQQYKNNNNNNTVQQCREGDDKNGRQLEKKDELGNLNSQPKLKEETKNSSTNLNRGVSFEEQNLVEKVEPSSHSQSNNHSNLVPPESSKPDLAPLGDLPKPTKLEESVIQPKKQELIIEKNGCQNETLIDRRTIEHKDYKKVPPLVIPFPGKQNSPTDLIKQDSPKLLINSIPKPFKVESPKEKEMHNNEVTSAPKIVLNDINSKDKTPDTDHSLSSEGGRQSTPDSPQISPKTSESPGPYVGIKANHPLKDLPDRQKPEPEKRDSKVIKAAQYWNNYIGECSSKSKPPPKASDKPKKIISAGIGEKGLKELTNAFETGKPIEPNDKFTLMRRNSKKMTVDNCNPGLRVNDAKSVFEKKNLPETPRIYRRSSISSEKSKWGLKSEPENKPLIDPTKSNNLSVKDEKVSLNSVNHSKSNSNTRHKSKSKSPVAPQNDKSTPKSPLPPQNDKSTPKTPAPIQNDKSTPKSPKSSVPPQNYIDNNKTSPTSNSGSEKTKEKKHRTDKPDLAPKPKTPEVSKEVNVMTIDKDDKQQEINLNIPKEQPKPPTSPKPKVKKEDLKLKEEHVKGKEEKLHPQRNCKKIDDSTSIDKSDSANLNEKITIKSPVLQRKSDSKQKLPGNLAEKKAETIKSPPLQKKSDSKKELVIINHSKKQAADKISKQISKNMAVKDKEGNNEKRPNIENTGSDKKIEVDVSTGVNKNHSGNIKINKEMKNISKEKEPHGPILDSKIKADEGMSPNTEINEKPDIDPKLKLSVGKSAENIPRTKNEFADVRSSLKKVPHVAVARRKSFNEKDSDEIIEPSIEKNSPVKEYKSEIIIPINMPVETPTKAESPTTMKDVSVSNHITPQQSDEDPVKERIIPIRLVNESKATGPKPFKLDTNNSRPQSPNNNPAPPSTLSPKTPNKQEHYIPIVVQSKGPNVATSREDDSEHSERLDNFNTGSISRRRWGSRKKRMSSAFSDSSVSDDDALTTPFGGLQKYTSYGKHGIHEQPLFRLKKTRPPFSVTRTDSFSSGEDDLDDDGFQEMTAENLFSTLLSRVKSLTRRIHDEHDEHLNWQQKQRHPPPKLNPGGTHARLERTAQRSSIKRTGDSTPSYTRQSSTYSSKGDDTPRSFNDSPTRPLGRSDSTYNPTRIYNRSVSNAENDSWYSDGTTGSRISGGISKRYDPDSDMGSDYSSNISVTSKQRLRPGYLPPPANNLNDNSYNSYSNRNSTSSDFSRNERTVPITIQRQDSHESPTNSKPGTPLPAQGVYMKHMKPFCPTQMDDHSENSSRMDSPEPLSEGSSLRKSDDRQRRVSRFLRPDFYETPKEESIYAKMRELEAEETKKPRFLRVVQQRKAKGDSSSGRNTPLDYNSYNEDKSLSESGSRTPQPEESKMAPPSEGSRASKDLRSLTSRRQPSVERKISSELNELEHDILQAGINKLRREGVEHSTEVSEMSDGLRTPENSEITNDIFGVPDFVKEGERSIGERLRKKSYLSRLNENDAIPNSKRGGPVTHRSVSKELFDEGLNRYTSSRPVARRSVSRELFTPGNGKPPRDYTSESESILSRRNPRRSRDSSVDRDTDVLSELESPSVSTADRSRSISLNRCGPRSESLSRFLPSRPSIASSGRTSKQSDLLRGSGISATSDPYRKTSVISPTADLYRVSPLTIQSHDHLRVSPRTVLSRGLDEDEGYGNGFKDRRRSDWRRISVPERGKDYNSLPRKYSRLDKKSFQ